MTWSGTHWLCLPEDIAQVAKCLLGGETLARTCCIHLLQKCGLKWLHSSLNHYVTRFVGHHTYVQYTLIIMSSGKDIHCTYPTCIHSCQSKYSRCTSHHFLLTSQIKWTQTPAPTWLTLHSLQRNILQLSCCLTIDEWTSV